MKTTKYMIFKTNNDKCEPLSLKICSNNYKCWNVQNWVLNIFYINNRTKLLLIFSIRHDQQEKKMQTHTNMSSN
jgi:hypothetical protein